MTPLKRFYVPALAALLVASACNRAAVEDPAPLETTEAPSPTPSPTPVGFELEGVVLEASGSAQAQGRTESPSPGQTDGAEGTASPAGETTSPEATTGPAGTGEVPLFQNAAPGSIALRLTSFSSTGPCVFNPNDTVVVSFTGNTTFEPADVTENERFPNNMERATLGVRGDVLEPDQGCVLVARSITVTQAGPTPTGRATARARTTRTPTATRNPSPRGTATASPTSPAPGGGAPGTPGTPGA